LFGKETWEQIHREGKYPLLIQTSTISCPSTATEGSYLRFLLKIQVVTWTRHEEKVNKLYLFGEYILSADAKGDIFIWAFRGADPSSDPVGNISLGEKFTPTCIMHPDTYLNKVPEIIDSLGDGLRSKLLVR
jgi:hypothetical protein